MPERRYIGALQDTFTISDVGSTLLEDLAKGIYRPHEVIREYVQNGVDAHRLYRSAAGLEPERPIGIEIRPDKLSIFDFGVGMDDDDIKKVKSVAVSRKRDADVILTGHKGVGIWAGLSYFDVLHLRTSKLGSDREYILTIRFKRIVEAISPEANIGDVLNPNYSINVYEANRDEHYTIVTLESPNPYRSPENFLDAENVEDAIRRTCPCEIDPNFVYHQHVADWYAQKGFECYPIEVRGKRVYKSFPSAVEDFRTDTITVNDEVVARYWYAVHQQSAKLSPSSDQLAGFRLIQHGFTLGDANPYSDQDLPPYAQLPRNNYLGWHIGEIHILSPRLRPNLQRNGLEESEATRQFVEKLRDFYRSIEYQDRVLSTKRRTLKHYQALAAKLAEYLSRPSLNLAQAEQFDVLHIKQQLDGDDTVARSRQRSDKIDALRDSEVKVHRQRLRQNVETIISRHSAETAEGHSDLPRLSQRPSEVDGGGISYPIKSVGDSRQEPPPDAPSQYDSMNSQSSLSELQDVADPDLDDETAGHNTVQQSIDTNQAADRLENERDSGNDDLDEESSTELVQLALVITLLEDVLQEELGSRDIATDVIVRKIVARIRWMTDIG